MEIKQIILIFSILSVFLIVGRAWPSNEVTEEYNNDRYNILQLNYINYRQTVNLTSRTFAMFLFSSYYSMSNYELSSETLRPRHHLFTSN